MSQIQRNRKRARPRHPGGRPSKATDEQLETLLGALCDWQRHTSKASAARAAGISLATLMRWQHQHPVLRQAWADGHRFRYITSQRAIAERAALRPRRPLPTRQMRLVAWFLVHRVRLGATVTAEHVQRACVRVNLSLEAWEAGCAMFPDLLASVGRKRARRWAYALEHGEIQIGWTPPDPNNPRTAARAWGSFQQRRGTFMAEWYFHDRRHSPQRGNPWL